jgi:predicted transposase/invertase (TIGR01784 family)
MQKGVVRGKQTGLKEGIVQGMIKERAKIASKMLRNGIDDATILKITKLDKNQLEILKNKNENKKKKK